MSIVLLGIKTAIVKGNIRVTAATLGTELHIVQVLREVHTSGLVFVIGERRARRHVFCR